MAEEASPAVTETAPTGTAAGADAVRSRPAWLIFGGLAVAVLVLDQLSKAWLVANVAPGQVVEVLGDWIRLVFSHNSGALFGLFGSSATLFGIGSIAVLALIVWYHARAPRSLLLSVALGLLLGGATGNLVDRLRLGFVVDFVDIGLGTLRFFTFNLGDAAISTAILLLLLIALLPARRQATANV